MKGLVRGALLLALCCWTFPPAALGQPADGCVTSRCHAGMGTKRWVHGPVGAGACVICHNVTEGKDHEFAFPAEQQDLCFACHETSRDMLLEESLHTPVANGDCVGCHDPHESDHRFSLKANTDDLCFVCHEQQNFEAPNVHGPVESGECNACHNPHASPFEKQLLTSRDELCFQCHEEQSDILGKRHVHAPVATDCLQCHDAHANVTDYLLPTDPPGLCFGCHTELAAITEVSEKHPPVASGQCGKCHDVHASEYPKLFPVAQETLCFRCHSDLAAYVGEQDYLHGPVKQGDCSACHDPHGSDHHRILRQDFPQEFYKPYAEESYAMCYECHNRQIVLDEKTETLTDFRDRDLNLHFLHVNKKTKGRSCRACHHVHAASQAKHIRESVPFGSMNWDLPVTFTKTENGGSCVVGCHGPKEYRRK